MFVCQTHKYHHHLYLLYLQWRVLSCLLFVDLSGNMTKLIIKDFECIPLQTLHNETCATLADDEIFYSDDELSDSEIYQVMEKLFT